MGKPRGMGIPMGMGIHMGMRKPMGMGNPIRYLTSPQSWSALPDQMAEISFIQWDL
jgi:hypothetical protein